MYFKWHILQGRRQRLPLLLFMTAAAFLPLVSFDIQMKIPQ